ncbi:hypothetical protein ACI2UY_22325 [Ralstonia nicotianae]
MQVNQPFNFDFHTGDVGHSVLIGLIGAGKHFPVELAKLWNTGHPGVTVSSALAGAPNAPASQRAGKKN